MRALALLIALFAGVTFVGCEKEKVIDVEGPGIDVEVDEDGETDVNIGDE